MTTTKGTCPECEFEFEAPALAPGETLACPECLLRLQVKGVVGEGLELVAIETSLDDWGQ